MDYQDAIGEGDESWKSRGLQCIYMLEPVMDLLSREP